MALQDCKAVLMKQKLLHIDMIELINRGRAILIAREEDKILLKDKDTGIMFYTGDSVEFLQKLPENLKKSIFKIVLHNRDLTEEVCQLFNLQETLVCHQFVYTQREKMSVSGLYRPDGQPMENGLLIHPLTLEQHDAVKDSYELFEDAGEDDEYGADYVRERIEKGCMFGAFVNDAFAGYIGIHDDGSIGMLHVFEEYRGQKLGKALQTYAINQALEWGWIPYGQVVEGNEVSMRLQDSLGLHMSKSPVVWVW
jgi:tRNA (guanine37-N1)-methyltransferase